MQWAQLPGDAVVDLLAAEHTPGVTELKRRANLQRVLEAQHEPHEAAALVGIAVSDSARSRINKGGDVAQAGQPYSVRLTLPCSLVLLATRASKRCPARLRRARAYKPWLQSGTVKRQYVRNFSTLKQAVQWRDETIFALHGMCARHTDSCTHALVSHLCLRM